MNQLMDLDHTITSSQNDPEPESELEPKPELVFSESRFVKFQGYKTGRKGAYRCFQMKKKITRFKNTSESGTDSIAKPLKRLDVHKRLGLLKPGCSKESAQNDKQERNVNKLLKPKPAINLLQQLKPGCTFKILEESQNLPPTFIAHIEYQDGILSTGIAGSKTQAKNLAAENALKEIFKAERSCKSMDINSTENPDENKSLVPLASYALYKLFRDWENEQRNVMKKNKPFPAIEPAKKKKKSARELPLNALDYHPSSLLNIMMPGLHAFQVRRIDDLVVMGYKIGEITYTGTAKGKKEAKREAAKAVLYKFFGVDFTQEK